MDIQSIFKIYFKIWSLSCLSISLSWLKNVSVFKLPLIVEFWSDHKLSQIIVLRTFSILKYKFSDRVQMFGLPI